MIPSLSEILYAVFGAWRLARRDSGGLQQFDVTPAGFYRSFFAAVLILPVYVATLLLGWSDDPPAAEPLRIFLVYATAYVTGWVAFPVIVYGICDAMGKSQSYTTLIVALNWSSLIYLPGYLLITLLVQVDLVWLEALGGFLAIIYLLWVLYYHWFIARSALQVSTAAAAGIIFVEMAIDLTIQSITASLLG